mmetsp:Transcript_32417/g.23950  ORF Transcript_32417/g.23950 Transcript_32417/m.23950 type:complete len:141 (-) Transcript_32417:37-459(-)
MKGLEEKAREYFVLFAETFAKSDKKTFKENLLPFFASADQIREYVQEPFPKFEEKAPDKWNDWFRQLYSEGRCQVRALPSKEESTLLPKENILIEQLREKPGGQLVEVQHQVNDKVNFVAVLCDLPSENWVLVYYAEKPV